MPSAKVIMPKGPVFKAAQIERAIQNTLTASAKAIKVDFDVTTQTFHNRPEIKVTTTGQYERTIGTSDQIYTYLDEGTRPHLIKPRKARFLVFNTPFQSKTLPNKIMSRGGSIGNVTVYSKGVRHPGTAARNFAKVIAKKWNDQLPAIFQRAIQAEYR